MNGDYTLARVARDFHPLALGPHPQRELTLMPRLGLTRPRLGMAAGAFTGAGAPPARTNADASPRIHTSSARRGRRRFCRERGQPSGVRRAGCAAAIANRSSRYGSFTARHSLLKIIVARLSAVNGSHFGRPL